MSAPESRLLLAQLPKFNNIGGAELFSNGGYADLLVLLERDNGVFHAGFRFTAVRAFRFCQEIHCTVWHMKDAYGQLVEITPSEWIADLRMRLIEKRRLPSEFDMHHYLTYIPDEGGAYEIIAQSWRALPESPGALPSFPDVAPARR